MQVRFTSNMAMSGDPPLLKRIYNVCIFVSLTVKVVHLELVSDLTSEAFIGALRRFVARRGYPHLIWSDHGKNFVGANHELKTEIAQCKISEFCASRSMSGNLYQNVLHISVDCGKQQ